MLGWHGGLLFVRFLLFRRKKKHLPVDANWHWMQFSLYSCVCFEIFAIVARRGVFVSVFGVFVCFTIFLSRIVANKTDWQSEIYQQHNL